MNTRYKIYMNSVGEVCVEIPAGTIGWLGSYFIKTTDWFKNHYNLSQTEIDEILAEMQKVKIVKIPGITNTPFSYGTPTFIVPDTQLDFGIKNEHKHEWEMYTGFREKFEHCKTCGQKKS